MQKFGWSRVAILQQAEEVFISVSTKNNRIRNIGYDSLKINLLINADCRRSGK